MVPEKRLMGQGDGKGNMIEAEKQKVHAQNISNVHYELGSRSSLQYLEGIKHSSKIVIIPQVPTPTYTTHKTWNSRNWSTDCFENK